MPTSQLSQILRNHDDLLLQEWVKSQLGSADRRLSPSDENALKSNSREFLMLFSQAAASGEDKDVTAPAWEQVRGYLTSLSASRAKEGFTPSETAAFVLS